MDKYPSGKVHHRLSIFAFVKDRLRLAMSVERAGLYCHLLDQGLAALGDLGKRPRSREGAFQRMDLRPTVGNPELRAFIIILIEFLSAQAELTSSTSTLERRGAYLLLISSQGPTEEWGRAHLT